MCVGELHFIGKSGQTDRQTGIHTDRRMHVRTYARTHIYIHTDKRLDGRTDRQADRQTALLFLTSYFLRFSSYFRLTDDNRQIGRQTDRQATGRQTNRQAGRQERSHCLFVRAFLPSCLSETD